MARLAAKREKLVARETKLYPVILATRVVELDSKAFDFCNILLMPLNEDLNLIKKQNRFSLSDPTGLWRR